jgi:hypothetical protein
MSSGYRRERFAGSAHVRDVVTRENRWSDVIIPSLNDQKGHRQFRGERHCIEGKDRG